MQTAIFKVQYANCNMQTAICKLQYANGNLQSANLNLQITTRTLQFEISVYIPVFFIQINIFF